MAAVQRLHQLHPRHTLDDIVKYYNHCDKNEDTTRAVLQVVRGQPFGSNT
jgi:hypothetical protein